MSAHLDKAGNPVTSWAGYRYATRARQNGRLVVVVQSAEAGIEDDPALPWTIVCDEHDGCVCHETQQLAKRHASDPAAWCDGCREEQQ